MKLKLNTPAFCPEQGWLWAPQELSLRRVFRVYRRIKKWWRYEELFLFRKPGLYNNSLLYLPPSSLDALCPWLQYYKRSCGKQPKGFFRLPREGVEIYYLGEIRNYGAPRLPNVEFFVFFDWLTNKDTLGKTEWTACNKQNALIVQSHIIDAAEWRAVELAARDY